jgi:hypothetical protein
MPIKKGRKSLKTGEKSVLVQKLIPESDHKKLYLSVNGKLTRDKKRRCSGVNFIVGDLITKYLATIEYKEGKNETVG